MHCPQSKLDMSVVPRVCCEDSADQVPPAEPRLTQVRSWSICETCLSTQHCACLSCCIIGWPLAGKLPYGELLYANLWIASWKWQCIRVSLVVRKCSVVQFSLYCFFRHTFSRKALDSKLLDCEFLYTNFLLASFHRAVCPCFASCECVASLPTLNQ